MRKLTTCLLLTLTLACTARADDAVMLVLDASGSMWGQIDGTAKIEIARDTVAGLVAEWPAGTDLGLVAYGHRRRGDCTDIETLIAPGELQADAFMSTVNGLQPVGMTPLSAAVLEAADALRYAERSATVILVSDGEETCDLDPCAVGTGLEEKGVDFTAHVIGFDVADPAHQAQLRCLAENTGGRFFSARDASELTAALGEAVQASVAVEPEPEAQPLEFAEVPLLVAEVRLAEAGPAVEKGVRWQLTRIEVGKRATRGEVSYDARLEESPEPGEYSLQVKVGQAELEREITVAAEPQQLGLVLDAGWFNGVARAAAHSPEIERGLRWQVRDAAGKQIANSYDGRPRLLLPAGTYRVELRQEKASTEAEFEVRAGEETELEVLLGSGQLRPTGYFVAGQPIESSLRWQVFPLADGAKPLANSYDADEVFTLPAGRYRIELKSGKATAAQEVEVRVGETTEIDVTLGAGALQLDTAAERGGRWQIFEDQEDLSGKRRRIHAETAASARLILPPGRYHVELKVADETHEGTVEVEAGKVAKLELGGAGQ